VAQAFSLGVVGQAFISRRIAHPTDTTPLIVVRMPVAPVLENGRRTGEAWPAVTVNGVALPIVAPLMLRNEMLPAQDAAVPSDALAARFATLISAVSVAPSPTGGRLKSRVVLVVCPNAEDMAPMAIMNAVGHIPASPRPKGFSGQGYRFEESGEAVGA
jgi:hypothetical protein